MPVIESLTAKVRRKTSPDGHAEANRRPPGRKKDRINAQTRVRSSLPNRASEVLSNVNEARLGLGPIIRARLNRVDLAVELGHTDGPALQDNNTEGVDLRQRQPDLNRIVDVQTGPDEAQPIQWTVPDAMDATKVFTVAAFTGEPNLAIEDFDPPVNFFDTLSSRNSVMDSFVDSQEDLSLIKNRKDLKRVLRRRMRRGLIKGLEGLYITKDNWEEALDTLQEEHFTFIGPSWNHDNGITHTGKPTIRDAEGAEPDTGLTKLGETVIEEIDNRGMIVDLSHASLQTQYDVLSIPSRLPRVFSHAGSRAVSDHPRNVYDDVARLVINGGRFIRVDNTIKILEKGEEAPEGIKVHKVKGGGKIGMPMVATFVKKNPGDQNERTNVENVVDHLEHFKEIGLLHGITIGSDFAGMGKNDVVEGVANVREFRQNLKETMQNRGFSEKEIRMVFRENALDFLLKNLPREQLLTKLKNKATIFTSRSAAPAIPEAA